MRNELLLGAGGWGVLAANVALLETANLGNREKKRALGRGGGEVRASPLCAPL